LAIFAFLFCVSAQNYIGYWWWSWKGTGGTAPPTNGTNIGIAFSGWTDVNQAVSESEAIKNYLPGSKFISLGGGNNNGAWTNSTLESINLAIQSQVFDGYNGIAYDIEEGDAGLADLFAQSFTIARSSGFKVLVTTSHTAPYGITDAGSLMSRFFNDSNIDYLSPQLYTSGTESQNDFVESGGVTWNDWTFTTIPIIPSIIDADYYSDAEKQFQSLGIAIQGYIQWANDKVVIIPPPPSTVSTVRCGNGSWADANTRCDKTCLIRSDCSHLPQGDCYADLSQNVVCASLPITGDPSSGKPKVDVGMIAGIVVGVLVLAVLAGVVYWKYQSAQQAEIS